MQYHTLINLYQTGYKINRKLGQGTEENLILIKLNKKNAT